jgi:hypothetical protein
LNWPRDGKLVVGGLKTEVTQARLLGDAGKPLTFSRTGLDLTITVPAVAPDAASSVILLECAGEPQADAVRLLASNVAMDTLRSFDAKLAGKLEFGHGKSNDDWVKNWTHTEDAVIWPVRITHEATFEATLAYDAPKGVAGARIVEGDAGKERAGGHKGAGGTYTVTLGAHSFYKPVNSGNFVREPLGRVTLAPGTYEFRVAAKEITGGELFRLRVLELKPVSE